MGLVDNNQADVFQPLCSGLTSPASINNNLGFSITVYIGFPIDRTSEKTRPTHKKIYEWNTYWILFLDRDGCVCPSNWAGLVRQEQLDQCTWIPYPAEAPAMINPYMPGAKKPGKSVDQLRKSILDDNPLKDSTNSMADPSVSNTWAPTDSSFITANAVDSRAEFSTPDITENVSVPPAAKANFFIPSNGGGGGGELFALGRRRILPEGNYSPQ